MAADNRVAAASAPLQLSLSRKFDRHTFAACEHFAGTRVARRLRGENAAMTPPMVLVVEDEPLILIDVETALEEAGFEVVTAANAAQAFKKFDASADTIRAVVTDIKLGKGASGWDIGRHVREAVPTMPVVYMSGDSSGDWTAQGVPNSIMIAKPFAFPQLITAISTLLNATD
jgi:DNA-binding response OmpR family regulator